MLYSLTTFAAAAADGSASGGLLDSLGIDWKMLILQSIAFLLLLFVLGKYVYPILVKAIDKREQAIAASITAAHEAEASAHKASEKTVELMKRARKDADEIVASAKAESLSMVDAAERKSRERTEQIMAEALVEIEKNIAVAKKSLRAETLSLVAEATEKVVRRTVDAADDKRIIAEAVKEVER